MEHWSTIVANIVTSLGILSFLGFYITHRQTQTQFSFAVMISCIERFQTLIPLIRNDPEDISRLKKYIDLTNEELFYFQRGYIPKEVIVEWLDSIVDYFPIYHQATGEVKNYDQLPFKLIHDQGLISGYPRLKNAFTHNEVVLKPDGSLNKLEVIKNVAASLNIKLSKKHFKRAMIS